MKTNKTKRMNQREYSEDLIEEQLTKLLQEAYEDEIPTLSEELLQKTLEKAEAAKQEAQNQSKVQPSFVRQLIGSVVVKRCVAVIGACILLVVCGKIVQENGAFVEKDAAPEMCKTESAQNETSGSMYFNGNTGNDIGMMADSAESMTEEECAEQESTDGLSQSATGTTDNSVMEQIESGNSQQSSKEEGFGGEDNSSVEMVEKKSKYENVAELLPLFPKELYETEAVYELWIDGVQVESGWESYMENALRHSPPEPLALQGKWSDELTEADTLPTDTIFEEQDILFTLIVSLGETKYYMEVGTYTKVTVEQNGEKRSTFFEILDLTLYEEILTMKP